MAAVYGCKSSVFSATTHETIMSCRLTSSFRIILPRIDELNIGLRFGFRRRFIGYLCRYWSINTGSAQYKCIHFYGHVYSLMPVCMYIWMRACLY